MKEKLNILIKERKERLQPCNIFPKKNVPLHTIKVHIFCDEKKIAISSVFKALSNDATFTVSSNNAQGYDAEKEKPDIAIFVPSYPAFIRRRNSEEFLSSIRYNSKLVICIPFGLLKHETVTGKSADYTFADQKEADAYIVDKLLYSSIEKVGLLRPSIVQIGNPKFDAIYNAMRVKQKLPKEWKKLQKKSVFLWTTDHMALAGNVTFDLYVSHFLNWFESHRDDCALIIRPHPNYVKELIKYGVWGEEDCDTIKKYCDNSENIIWDDRPDYTLAYSLADCVFVDVNCGIILTALTLDKPICALRRFDGQACKIDHPAVIHCHNVANNPEELVAFLEKIRNDEDPKADLRKKALSKFIGHYDGKNGRRIKEFIEKMYREKF
jgi:dsDNA-binding SOS-regulon protein